MEVNVSMKCSKKIFTTIVITTLLVISMGITLPVKADTDVTVTTTGNVQVVIYTNGTVNLIYNGVNIQAEINGLKAILASMTYQMSQLATKTEVANLNQTVYQLIGELDKILDDLYGKTNYLANIIGFNADNSIVAANLKSGTSTITKYLDSILTTLDSVADDIETLDTRISSVYNELQDFENYVDGRFNATYLEIETLGNYTDTQLNNLYIKLHGEIQDLKASTLQLVNSTYIELNGLTESLRKDVLADLLTLESRILDETDRQDFTELQLEDLQRRLYNAENALGALVLIFIVLAILLVAIGIKSKLRRRPKNVEADKVQFGDGEHGRGPPKKSFSSDTTKVRLVKEGDKLRFVKQDSN